MDSGQSFHLKKWLPSHRILALTALVTLLTTRPANAQAVPGANTNLAPVTLAQATAPPQFVPTDITPYTIHDRNVFTPGYKFKLFKALPERLWLTSTTEVSQRLDTNSLFTSRKNRPNYAFRVLPNVSVGYNVFKNTSIYANYFLIKDVFARDYSNINFPTTQSVSWGIQQVQPLGEKMNLQFNLQARELWLTSHVRFFDLLPGATLTRELTPNSIVFASTLLQLRGSHYFVPANREIDPFYTIGFVAHKGVWTFIATDTYVTNFRRHDSVPQTSNESMIMDLEVNRPVTKRAPSVVAFVRAEPIWNWDSHKTPGISGFDFRLYGGLRLVMSKPSYYGAIKDLRKQIQESVSAPDNRGSTSSNPANNSNNTSYSNNDRSNSPNTSSTIPISNPQTTISLRGM